jgi:glycopeptide antibiotics resistance protein
MFWNKYFWPSFVLMLAVVILHWVASFEGFYWSVGWYDIMMHFLGGLWTLFFALWAVHTEYATKLVKYVSIKNLILFVLVVGLLWEAHEIILRFADPSHPDYMFDTIMDLIMDTLGGILGIFIYRKSIKNKS